MKLWNETEKILSFVGLNSLFLFIGFAGAAVAQIKRTDKAPFWQRALYTFIGALAAAYIGPLVAHFIRVENERVEYGVVFFVGLFAKELFDFTTSTIQFASKNQELFLSLKNRFTRK